MAVQVAKLNSFQPNIVAFCCENSGYLAAQMASEAKLTFPQTVTLVKLPCSGRIDALFLFKALEKGADGVMVLACQKENCKFLKGNVRAEQRIQATRKALQRIGVQPERVAFCHLAGNMGHKFVEEVQSLYSLVTELGPNPGKVRK